MRNLSRDNWLELYTYMRRMRAIEEKAVQLFHEGRTVGRVYTGRGQEAIPVGSTYALETQDALAPIHRDLGAYLIRGITARQVFCQYLGRANSSNRGKDAGLHISAPELGLMVNLTSPIPASLPVATGLALTFQIRREPRVALTFFGDGATSTGAFHESVNFAAVRKLPIVLICENNQWALSTPTNKQFALKDLSLRAAGYGIPGVQIDGNDVLAVFEATAEAVARARAGDGPTFIEAVTMRMHGHSASDPAQYVPAEMLEEWQTKDPIRRFAVFLRREGALDDGIEAEIERAVQAEVQDAVRFAEDSPILAPEEALADVFASGQSNGNS